MGVLRVAVVGLGPKGLFALERLLDRATGLDDRARIEVDVFEPHPVPGAGPHYDPRQPSFLRMNIPADAVSAWPPSGTSAASGPRPSFVAWAGGGDGSDYPPRAQVGRYLADCLATMLRRAPAAVQVTIHSIRADAVSRRGARWEVLAAGTARAYDEVLLATGHEATSGGSLAPAWTGPAPLVASVFPIQRLLDRDVIAPGAVVAVRGFALTFIDAALALTEGRGGSFAATPEHPHRLRYFPGGDEVAVILPFSRTGRPMLAKPDPVVAAAIPGADVIAAAGCARLAALVEGVELHRELLPILAGAATDLLRATRGGHAAGGAVAIPRWLKAAAAGSPTPASGAAIDEITRSVAVGAGLSAPDAMWALGHTWRTLYPALVSRLGDGGLAERDWPAFRRLATEMERVAFGPAPLNAAKLLALVEAGRIDLTHVHGGTLRRRGDRTRLCSRHGGRAVDAVVDAVLPGPGATDLHRPPLRALLDDGHVRIAAARRGLDVDAGGGCRSASGALTPGLAAIGRVTEDVVIGNDTLSRTLHPLADRWADKVVERAREQVAQARPVTAHPVLG